MTQVTLMDKMGSDLSVVNSARVSFAKEHETMQDNDEKLISSVYKIMQKDFKFKALMVQKISFMEVKVAHLNDYSIKRDSLINLIKSNKK